MHRAEKKLLELEQILKTISIDYNTLASELEKETCEKKRCKIAKDIAKLNKMGLSRLQKEIKFYKKEYLEGNFPRGKCKGVC